MIKYFPEENIRLFKFIFRFTNDLFICSQMRTLYSVLNHQQPYIGKDLYVNNFAEVENVHGLSVLQKAFKLNANLFKIKWLIDYGSILCILHSSIEPFIRAWEPINCEHLSWAENFEEENKVKRKPRKKIAQFQMEEVWNIHDRETVSCDWFER